MDLLTISVFAAFILIVVAHVVEIAIKRPKTFLEMTAGARAFAEQALEDATSAAPEPATRSDSPRASTATDHDHSRLAA